MWQHMSSVPVMRTVWRREHVGFDLNATVSIVYCLLSDNDTYYQVSFTISRTLYYVSEMNCTATCFEHSVVIFRELKYTILLTSHTCMTCQL
jgi:hypothetical protein